MKESTKARDKEFLSRYHHGHGQQKLSQRIVYRVAVHIHDIRQRKRAYHHLSHADIQKYNRENRSCDKPFQAVVLVLLFFRLCFFLGFGSILLNAEAAFCHLFDDHFGRHLCLVIADDELTRGQVHIGANDTVQFSRDALDGTAAGGARHARNGVFFLSHFNLQIRYRGISTNIIA